MDVIEAIYMVAATGRDLKWPLLKAFLLKNGVDLADLDKRSSQEWMKEYEVAKEELNELSNDVGDAGSKAQRTSEKAAQRGSAKVEDRGRSMGSRRESDSDSGYQSDKELRHKKERPEAVAFLVPGHPKYEHGIVNLYCKYCDDDDQSYIKRQALKRLNLDEGTLGEVILSFLDKDQSLDRVFFVQDHTSRGEELESDILFGMKPAARSVIEESPLEEFSPAPFDGHNKLLQTRHSLMSQRQRRRLDEDELKFLAITTGTAEFRPDEDPSIRGQWLGMTAAAVWEAYTS